MAKVELWNATEGSHDDAVAFRCPGCKQYHRIPFGQGLGARWTFNGDLDTPTLSPSILVRWQFNGDRPDAICHSFVRDGMI